MRIRAQRSKVELERGGNDGKWMRSRSTITRTITHTITNTITNVLQLRSQRAEEEEDGGTTQEWTLSYFARTLALCQDSSKDSTDELASAYDPEDEAASDSDPEDRTKSNEYLGRVDTIVFCERWRYRRLENYRILRALARANSGNYRKMRALVRANSGNYRILRALARAKVGTPRIPPLPRPRPRAQLCIYICVYIYIYIYIYIHMYIII